MDKRFLAFILFSFIIMALYPFFLEKTGLVPPPPATETGPATVADTDSPETEDAPRIALQGTNQPTGQETPAEQTLQVETPLYRALISNRGGALIGWELKRYTADTSGEPIRLFKPRPGGVPAFALLTGDAVLDQRLAQGLYQVAGEDLDLRSPDDTGEIRLSYLDGETRRRFSKRFMFSADSYRVVVDLETDGIGGGLTLTLGTNFGITDWGESKGFVGFIGPITYLDDEMKKDNPAKFEGTIRHEGRIGWTSLQDKYFIAAAIPSGARAAVLNRAGPQEVSAGVEFDTAATGRTSRRVTVYAGPKEHDRLQAMGVHLEGTIDFGWFVYGSWGIVRFLAEPLFYVLRFFHGYLGNYGIAIVLLTVCVRGLFIPLTHKAYSSMKNLQVLQPDLQALQKKHKDDRQRLQREMMALYQKNKVNPLGGCLPMILQIPVFVALFNVLYTTIELRHAPFVLWIQDLSAKDPYYVLPVMMGITMVVQQRMQPTTMEPTQAKMMMLLPVFITFLFLSFPSGLVIYMLTNNVLTISQQYLTMKYFEKPREAVLEPTIEKEPAQKESGKKETGKGGGRKKG